MDGERTCHLNIGEMGLRVEFHDAPESSGVQRIFKFPECVASEILAWMIVGISGFDVLYGIRGKLGVAYRRGRIFATGGGSFST